MLNCLIRSAAVLMWIGLFSGMLQSAQAGNNASPDNRDKSTKQDVALTLENAVRIALEANPSIRAALGGVTTTQEAAGEARSLYYPRMDLVVGYNRWERHAFLPSGLVMKPGVSKIIGPTDDWFAGVRTEYNLFDSGRRRADLQAALARIEVAREEGERIRNDIAFLVHQSYFELAAAQELESVAKKKLSRAEDHLRLATERKEAGAVSKADVIRARVDVADAEMALEKAESRVRIAKGNLNASMGFSPDEPVEIDARPLDILPPETIPIAVAFETALRERSEIKAARQAMVVARNGVDSSRSASGPKIMLQGNYGWRDEAFIPVNKDWLAGITLELPIFTGFANSHNVGKARAELSRKEAELESLILSVRQDVWAAFSNLKETYHRVQSTELLVRDAEESVRQALERYDAGAGTITDLMDSEAALARAEGLRTETRWIYHIARSAFGRSIGTLAEQ